MRAFKRYQPVAFPYKGCQRDGYVVGLSKRFVKVVTVEGFEYQVPDSLVQPNGKIGPKRNLSAAESRSLLFIPDDEVEFSFEASQCHGHITDVNRRTARVVGLDDTRYVVPYKALRLTYSSQLERSRASLLETIAAKAVSALDENNLLNWGFDYDRATSRAGICRFEEKMIVLSNSFCFRSSEEEVTDTILHEIAHALVGPDHHHDSVWLEQARAIGGTGSVLTAIGASRTRYIKYCESCGWKHRAQRKVSRLVCRQCGSDVRYLDYSPRVWKRVNPLIDQGKHEIMEQPNIDHAE